MNTGDFKTYFYTRSSASKRKSAIIEVPVYLRIQVGRNRKDMATHAKGPLDYWSNNIKRFDSKSGLAKRANDQLDLIEKKLNRTYWELVNTKGEFDLKTFFDHYHGNSDLRYLLKTFEERLAQLKKLQGKEYTRSTIVTYEVSFRHLAKFIRQIDKEDLLLIEMNKGFIRAFYEYLRIGMTKNSANKNLRKLRAVLYYAIENEYLDKNPMKGFSLKDEDIKRDFLNDEELNKIAAKKIKIERLEVIRDIFLFQCFTGLAFTDIKSLAPEHLVLSNDKLFISKNRQKTEILADIPIMPEANKLLKKYEYLHADKKCFPVPTNQKMNAYLKEIADLCGIKKELTSHIGRHTFAMMMLNRGMSVEALTRIMGLSTAKHIKVYAKMLTSTLSKEMESMGKFLK